VPPTTAKLERRKRLPEFAKMTGVVIGNHWQKNVADIISGLRVIEC